jgi:hypothetical protein
MTTATKTYYFGTKTGEVVCAGCAGYALKSAIGNKPNAKSWAGAQERFAILSTEDVIELSVISDVCFCKAGE